MSATVLVPERSLEQRRAALDIANATRIERADLKRQMREMTRAGGARLIASLLDDQPAWLASMRVEELLRCVRGWGDVRVASLMVCAAASSRKRLGALSARQCEVLSAGLRADAARWSL